MNLESKITFSIIFLLIGSVMSYAIISEPNDESQFVVDLVSYATYIIFGQYAIHRAYHSLRYDENSTLRTILRSKMSYFMIGLFVTFFLISSNAEYIASNYEFGDQTNFDTQITFLTYSSQALLGALLLTTLFYVGKYADFQKNLNQKFSIVEEYYEKSKSKHRPMTDEERQDVFGFYHFISKNFADSMFELNKTPKMAIGIVLVLSVLVGMSIWSLYSDGIPNSVEYIKSVASFFVSAGSFVIVWIYFQTMLDEFRKYDFWMNRQVARIKAYVPAEFFSKREIDEVENA